MLPKYNTKPVDDFLNDGFSPIEASVILDRVIIGYMFALLKDKEGEIARDEVIEEMCLLVELRDRTRECSLN